MKWLTTLLAVAAAAVPAACGEDRTPETDASRVPGPTDTIVVYERTGGEEGARERLDVRPDGVARVRDGDRSARFRLNDTELRQLVEAREGVDFAALEERYASGATVLDGYETRLAADGHTVTIGHEAEVPIALERLRATSAALIERHRPR
jgi:hypothetical protein